MYQMDINQKNKIWQTTTLHPYPVQQISSSWTGRY